MASTFPLVELSNVLRLSLDSVPVDIASTYQMAGVYSFGKGLFAREPLSGTNTTYKTLNRLNAGEFILSQVKGWEGALASVSVDMHGRFLSPVFSTFRVVPDKLLVQYLSWYCKQRVVWEQLQGMTRGIGARRETVSPERFLQLLIPLPPLMEQQGIVAKIEALAGKIEEVSRLHSAVNNDCDLLCRSFLFGPQCGGIEHVLMSSLDTPTNNRNWPKITSGSADNCPLDTVNRVDKLFVGVSIGEMEKTRCGG